MATLDPPASRSNLKAEIGGRLRVALEGHQGGTVALLCPPILNQMLNLCLLEHLLAQKGQRGIYATVYRSHLFMRRLLQMARVPLDRLTIIDAIHRLEHGRVGDPPKGVHYIVNPFQDNFPIVLTEIMAKVQPQFVVVDHLSSLLDLVTLEQAQGLWRTICTTMDQQPEEPAVYVVLDRDRSAGLVEAVRASRPLEIGFYATRDPRAEG